MCCSVRRCCCCVSLRVGSIVIASFYLVVHALQLAYNSYMLHMLKVTEDDIWLGRFGNGTLHSETRLQGLWLVEVWTWLVVAACVMSIMAVLLHIVLLAGAVNARPGMLWGWIVGYPIIYSLHLLGYGTFILFSLIYNVLFLAMVLFLSTAFHTALTVYFWVVVRSYHRELAAQFGGGGPNTAGKVYHTGQPPAAIYTCTNQYPMVTGSKQPHQIGAA